MNSTYPQLIDAVATQVNAWRTVPVTKIAVVGLSTGGFPVARHLSKKLGVPSAQVFGVPVVKQDSNYWLSGRMVLDLSELHVVLIDDSTRRGVLLRDAAKEIQDRFRPVRVVTAALLASRTGIPPTIVGELFDGDPPSLGI